MNSFGSPDALFPWEQDWLEPMHDISVAGWIAESVRYWRSIKKDAFHLGHLVPDGFDAYARLFHPAYRRNEAGENVPVRWAQIAVWNGRTAHPLMQFHRIANPPESNIYGDSEWGNAPQFGSLPSAECQVLAGLLREFTESPDLYYFCFWDGYGQEDFIPTFKRQPKVSVDIRDYFLFRGILDPELAEKKFRYQSPSLWWPSDRAWFVATEIDVKETMIGGGQACIERVLNHSELEAMPVAIDDNVGAWGDTINPPLASTEE